MAMVRSFVEHLLRWATRRTVRVQNPLVIGVTGSSGKTSTKEAIGHVLRKTVRDRIVRVGHGNLNSEFGLPLVVLGLQKPEGKLAWVKTACLALWRGLWPERVRTPLVLVLEYGVEYSGDMAKLVSIVPPQVAVVTVVGEAHTEFLGSLDGVAKEKGGLVRALPKSGIAILNANDRRVMAMGERTQALVVPIKVPLAELSQAMAVAVAEHALGVERGKAEAAMKDWTRPKGRLQLLKALKGAWLLDDSYNANPNSMTFALSELQRITSEKKARRSIAVLGDMLELGSGENKAHAGIALLAERVADRVVLVGPRFRRTKRGEWYPGPVQAADALAPTIEAGDVVLVKGSQGMRMEKVSEALLANPREAHAVLERQTPYWKAKPYVAP